MKQKGSWVRIYTTAVHFWGRIGVWQGVPLPAQGIK